MPDWIIVFLSGLQRSAVSTLTAELRTGGWLTAVLAFALGALHALTPGHGKAALAAFFLGQDARIGTGLRVTLLAAFLHVVMGALAFLVLRVALSQTPLLTARGSPFFAATGYGLILFAGAIMLFQSLRSTRSDTHPHALTFGVGLLPCPLTISVLGFAWAQAGGVMVVIVLIALAAGIAFTIGSVVLLAIFMRRFIGRTLIHRLSGFERAARILQGMAGGAIIIVAGYSLWMTALASK